MQSLRNQSTGRASAACLMRTSSCQLRHSTRCNHVIGRPMVHVGAATVSIADPKQHGDVQHKQVQTPPEPHAEQEHTASTYSWTKQWWPVFPVFQLDKRKPHPVTMLGKDYVVWWDNTTSQWSVLDDRCPHRLAQLSMGRIMDGNLQCSYHGWSFNNKGTCVNVPQIGDEHAAKAALSSARTCVPSYPTRVEKGLLFAWLDDGPDAYAEAKAAEKSMVSELVAGEAGLGEWACSTQPTDYTFWVEQGVDPSHAPFLHHGKIGFDMKRATPVEHSVVSEVDLNTGFAWEHGGYDTNTANVVITRTFMPPHSNLTVFKRPADDKGHGEFTLFLFQTMTVPVRPGVCRTIGKFGAPPKKRPAPWFKLPEDWAHVLNILRSPQSEVVDQDNSIMNGQETSMRQGGLTRSSYRLIATADQGVNALHRWLQMAGYDRMWDERTPAGGGWRPRSVEEVTSAWNTHTKDCVVCQKAYGKLTQLCTVLAGMGIALAAGALVLVAASRGVDLRSAAAAAVSGLCLWAWHKLTRLRDERFISSAARWRALGGLSLVGGVRIPA